MARSSRITIPAYPHHTIQRKQSRYYFMRTIITRDGQLRIQCVVDVSKLSDDERLDVGGQLASNLHTSLPKQLDAGSFTLKSKLPYKATSFREVLIHRVSDIADVAIELYRTDRLVPAFIATLAVVETTAMVYWLYQRSRVSRQAG